MKALMALLQTVDAPVDASSDLLLREESEEVLDMVQP